MCFVRVVDGTRTGLEPRVGELLKQALLSNAAVNVVPTEELVDAAKKRGIPKKRWLDRGVLAAVADELDVDYLISARIVSTSRYSYKVTVIALDRSATTLVAAADVTMAVEPGKGRGAASFSSAEASTVIDKLLDKLGVAPRLTTPEQPTAPEQPTEQPTKQPTKQPTTPDKPDDWGGDWSADATSSTPAAVDAILNSLAPTFGGRIGVDGFWSPSDLWAPRDETRVAGRQQVDLGIRAAVGGKKASGHAALLIRRDFADPNRNRLEAEEAYADVDLGFLKLRAGRSYVSWGTADLYNPSEVLAHFDWRDVLDVEKFPTWNLKVASTLEPFTLEGYILPVAEANILPPVLGVESDGTLKGRNRWVKGKINVEQAPVPVRIRLVDGGPPAPNLDNIQAALRLRVSLFGIDSSLGYAYLWDRFPTLRAPDMDALRRPLPAAVIDADVRAEYLRRHAFTADFEAAVGSVRFSGEGVVYLTKDAFVRVADDEVEDPFGSFVLGIDWETPRFFDDHGLRIFVNVTATMTLTGEPLPTIADPQDGVGPSDNPVDMLRYPLPVAVLTRVEYLIGETFKAELTLVDGLGQMDLFSPGADITDSLLNRHDLYLAPAIQMVFADVVTARIEGALLAGTRLGTFGRYPENSRVGGSVGVSF